MQLGGGGAIHEDLVRHVHRGAPGGRENLRNVEPHSGTLKHSQTLQLSVRLLQPGVLQNKRFAISERLPCLPNLPQN